MSDTSSVSEDHFIHPLWKVPVEILRLIFGFALCDPSDRTIPTFLRDVTKYETSRDEREISRTKLAITLVSRSWREVATQLLYDRVEIRNISKLVHLVDVLRSSQNSGTKGRPHGWWIRAVRLELYVPHNLLDLYTKYVCLLCAISLNLTSFVIASPDPFPDVFYMPGSILHALADSCGPKLHSVIFRKATSVRTGDLDYLLSRSPNLQHLGVYELASGPPAEVETFLDGLQRRGEDITHFSLANREWRDSRIDGMLRITGPHLTTLHLDQSVTKIGEILSHCSNLAVLSIDDRAARFFDLPDFQHQHAKSVTRLYIQHFLQAFHFGYGSIMREKEGIIKVFSLPSLQYVCALDRTVYDVRQSADLYHAARELWKYCCSHLRTRSILFVDRNGAEFTEDMFSGGDGESESEEGSEYHPEESEGSEEYSDFYPSSDMQSIEADIESDTVREVSKRYIDRSSDRRMDCVTWLDLYCSADSEAFEGDSSNSEGEEKEEEEENL